MTTVVFVIHSL